MVKLLVRTRMRREKEEEEVEEERNDDDGDANESKFFFFFYFLGSFCNDDPVVMDVMDRLKRRWGGRGAGGGGANDWSKIMRHGWLDLWANQTPSFVFLFFFLAFFFLLGSSLGFLLFFFGLL